MITSSRVMKIYVGRWDLLPKEWEGYNDLVSKCCEEIVDEIGREIDVYAKTHYREDKFMGVYTPREFEDTFNCDLVGKFKNETYWIRIF